MPCFPGLRLLLGIPLDVLEGSVQLKHHLTSLRLQVVKLTSFAPFKNAAHALDEVNAISEAVVTDDLKNFLEVNLPKVGPLVLSHLFSIAPSLESHLSLPSCAALCLFDGGRTSSASPKYH